MERPSSAEIQATIARAQQDAAGGSFEPPEHPELRHEYEAAHREMRNQIAVERAAATRRPSQTEWESTPAIARDPYGARPHAPLDPRMWGCPKCGHRNIPERKICQRCRTHRPGAPEQQASPAPRPPDARPADLSEPSPAQAEPSVAKLAVAGCLAQLLKGVAGPFIGFLLVIALGNLFLTGHPEAAIPYLLVLGLIGYVVYRIMR